MCWLKKSTVEGIGGRTEQGGERRGYAFVLKKGKQGLAANWIAGRAVNRKGRGNRSKISSAPQSQEGEKDEESFLVGAEGG